MRKLLAVVLFCVIPLPFATAQSSAPWYVGKPIKSITFTGLVHVTQNDLQGIIQPYIGKDFSDTLFWDLQSKLYALDYFEQFTPNAEPADSQKNAVVINFQVVERPIVSEIKITGNTHIRTSDILAVVTLKKDDIINKTKLRSDSDAIQNLYQGKGYPNVKVTSSMVENNAAKTAVVTFTIDEGSQSKVKAILFEGNHFASDGTLKRLLKTKEQSLFNSGIYQESNIAED
ncbi:MAG TPA: POTRA domain-containing protein, partial [Spirochaetia bacterium]|nr:POTRA domain-containing protein [Spirochaetia bacterium]